MESVLEVRNLTKYYGKTMGVENVSFALNKGDIFGFIGPNGAGKSTTIRAIMTFINKTEGEILVNGIVFDKNNLDLKNDIGYLPSEVYLYEDLSVKEMLDYHERFYKKNLHQRRMELVELLKVDESKKIEDLSLGNKKKIGIILALMHEPKLLILDEPTSGLDPIMQQVFFNLLVKEKEKGTTILYSTHILSEISKLCNRVGIIKNGHLLKVEDMQELSSKNLFMVNLISDTYQKIISELKAEVIWERDNNVSFKYQGNSNSLLACLSKYDIQKLLIEEPTLEDIFMHYYE